ncbi:unnamed protein product, partial [Ectocarpus sp. 12 AP-2014]
SFQGLGLGLGIVFRTHGVQEDQESSRNAASASVAIAAGRRRWHRKHVRDSTYTGKAASRRIPRRVAKHPQTCKHTEHDLHSYSAAAGWQPISRKKSGAWFLYRSRIKPAD